MADSEIFDGLAALADPLRGRILLVLERHEMTVTELCAVFQVPQSTMSRQLKVLADEGWAAYRAEGASRLYRMASSLDPAMRGVWRSVRDRIAALPAARADAERIAAVLAERRTRSREFFTASAGEWDRLRRELIGRRQDLLAVLALLDASWTVGDLGCGTGVMAEALAPFVGRVIAVDGSPIMLEAARSKLGDMRNVEVVEGELERLPLEDGSLDAAILCLALSYVPEPEAAIAEAARVLRPGGRLVVADLAEHDREDYRQRFGHQWLGFSEAQIVGWLRAGGLRDERYIPLAPDPEAKGPRMFSASATRPV